MNTNLTNRELTNQVEKVASFYFLARRVLKECGLPKENDLKNHPFFKFVVIVQLSFKSLNNDQKRLINNEYFYQAYPEWWMGIYETEDYEKLKIESIKAFLRGIYNEK